MVVEIPEWKGAMLGVEGPWSALEATVYHTQHTLDFDNLYIIWQVSAQGSAIQGPIDTAHHTGGIFTPKPSLLECEWAFSRLYAQNIKTRILSKMLHRFQPNFLSDEYHQTLFAVGPILHITNPRLRNGRYFDKIEKSSCLKNDLTD